MTRELLKYLLLVACVAAVGAAPSSFAESDEPSADEGVSTAAPSELAEWIAQLDDNRYLVREKATQHLIDAGVAALDPLLAVANGDRLEPADRAVWILRRLAKSSDNTRAIASLERIVQLKGRPTLVEKADLELAQRSVKACQDRLTPLGAELSMIAQPLDFVRVVPLLNVTLSDKWHGTEEDLKCIAQLRRQFYYRLEGEAFNDKFVKFIEEKEKVEFLQLWYTKVTPAAVDSLKARHPEAIVYVRGDALLGVKAKQEPHPAGVLVDTVQPGSGAFNAGIVAGDIIASIDGNSLPDFDRLTAHIAQHRPGSTVPLEVIRGGERMKLDVTLGSWAGQQP
jgi:hypothetical protein